MDIATQSPCGVFGLDSWKHMTLILCFFYATKQGSWEQGPWEMLSLVGNMGKRGNEDLIQFNLIPIHKEYFIL